MGYIDNRYIRPYVLSYQSRSIQDDLCFLSESWSAGRLVEFCSIFLFSVTILRIFDRLRDHNRISEKIDIKSLNFAMKSS